ncbi:MAG: chloramphenicol resistance protein [Clostridium sp.]
MIIEGIRNFIRTCPYLNEFAKGVNVDYLDDTATSYSIEETPCEPVIKKYVNGDTIRQYDFIFCSRESYGADVLQNIENSGFYEHFAKWLEDETNSGTIPLIDGNVVKSILATTIGYAFQTDVDEARYQIQCKLIYFKEGIK